MCVGTLRIREVDLHQSVAIEQFERARGRHIDDVIEIDSEELAARFEHADDAKLQSANAHSRSQRVIAAE